MNEKRTHLISCPSAHMDVERIKASDDKTIEFTYLMHVILRHSGDKQLEMIARQI